jgi:uncharacterized protein YndB with AHSA1/START domain
MIAKSKSNEIHITRVYDAPVKAVWDAFTEPDQVAQWWGPRGFTLTTHGKELKPGGIWNYTMHGPDGTDYENKTLYHEVEQYKKLVYDHGGNDDRPPMFRVTVLFSETSGTTTMEMTMAFPTAEEAESSRKFIKQVGGNSTWDRLAEYLNLNENSLTSFVINRSFEAPQNVVFDLWADPDHFSKWLPPIGFDMEIQSGNIGAGQTLQFKMTDHAETTLFGKIEYREIDKPNRIEYLQSFCDEKGNIARHPALPVFPETLLTTVVFTEESNESSRVTVTVEPFGSATEKEIGVFLDIRTGMTQGWTGSFDKLESLLTNIPIESV